MSEAHTQSARDPLAVEASRGNQFGTFGGVFTPSILTILGVVMFMRSGFVVGQAGIWSAIIILGLSKTITMLTGLSISAVSTNTKVQGGGAYFLISRSLGLEFGASIGLALFLAQALSVPFYILGFVEAMTATQPHLQGDFLLIGLVITSFIFFLNLVGSSWALRAQYFILAVLVVSIVVFMSGGIADFETSHFTANLATHYTEDENFWSVFAVFFPAVTGIMAGVNMSGDLKAPEKSIPRGTLLAIVVSGLVYLAQILVLGGASDAASLAQAPYQTLLDMSAFGFTQAIVAGVYAATLSSAIGSMMGAPRILQALARDRVFPILNIFARGSGAGDEPRYGLILTCVMTVGVLVIAGDGGGGGALNIVANVLTMFFLFTYGMTNVAAFIEHLSRNPSFRPRFRYFHWTTALLGGVGCFGVAFLINWTAALMALAMIAVIFLYISRRVLETNFGDARRGFTYERVRTNLRKLASQPTHPKNWRPTTLVLSGNPNNRLTLTTYAGWLASGSGIVTLANIVVGDIHEHIPMRRQQLTELEGYISEHNLGAFAEVHVSPTFEDGFAALLQSHSIGPLKPNMLLLGWPGSGERAAWFGKHLRLTEALGISQVIMCDQGLPTNESSSRRIDIWWRGLGNGSLMAILAYLLQGNWPWRHATLRLLHVHNHGESIDVIQQQIQHLIDEGRLDAQTVIIEPGEQAGSFSELAIKHSADADLVMLGFKPPIDDDAAQGFYTFYSELVAQLPTTLLIHSSGDADLLS
jgi:amino acid transporter